MQSAGVVLLDVDAAEPGVDLAQSLRALAERGITRLLVEGGASLAAALLRADLVDRIAWFHAPSIMGGDGWPAARPFGIEVLADMPRFQRMSATPVGEDFFTEYCRAGVGE